MAITSTDIVIPVGGGMGNQKIYIIELNGEYEKGGFAYETSYFPTIILPEQGLGAQYDEATNKIILRGSGATSGGHVTLPTDLGGATIAPEAIEVEGDVGGLEVTAETTEQLVSKNKKEAPIKLPKAVELPVEAGSPGSSGELPAGTKIDGLRILIVCMGSMV